MANPKAPEESFEVSWPLDGTTVYGTLVKPAGPGPFPAVVMVAGSGPTDRDWNSPLLPGTNGSARLLASALAEAGLASLRYDKRASGPHVAENMPQLIGKLSMQSHLDELAGAVRLLASRPEVDASRLFGLGNSEGNLHVLNYQVHDPAIPFAGLVLTAPPGRAIGRVARSQIANQVSSLPNGAEVLAAYDAAISRFTAGAAIAPDPSLPEGIQMLLRSLETPANLPFARELWSTDATTWLGQVRVPVLVVIGEKDIQVDYQADGAPLRQAAAGRDVTFLFPENANHVLKHEARSRAEVLAAPAEATLAYNSSDARLDPEALSGMLDWLTAHA